MPSHPLDRDTKLGASWREPLPRDSELLLTRTRAVTDEHMLVTASAWPRTRPCKLPNLPLEDALQRVHLYAERGSPKFERGPDDMSPSCPLWVDSHEVVPTIRRVRGTNPVSAGRATRSAGAKSPRSPTQGDRPQTAILSTALTCVIVTPGVGPIW